MIPNYVRKWIRDELDYRLHPFCLDESDDLGKQQTEKDRRVETWLDSLPAKPQPDWSEAPKWAQWWAVDANEESYWFESHPQIDTTFWMPLGDCKSISDAFVALLLGIDWRTTLRKRPQEVSDDTG